MKKLKVMLIILHSSFLILGIHPFGANCFSQWVQQPVPVNKPITGIEFIDTLHGWACTSRGTPADTGYILYTVNGGTNWLVQLPIYNTDFTDLDMLNGLTGYVSGHDWTIARGKLYSTTNGGINWMSVTLVQNMDIGDMQFLNKDSAWECGPAIGVADVRTTTDGGNSWIIRNNGISSTDAQRVFFLNYDTGFCAAGYLFKTTNAGLNWVQLTNVASNIITAIFFFNQNTGWLGNTNKEILFTSNGGLNWISQNNPEYFNTIRTLFFVNYNTGWAGGGLDYIYKTTNGGQLWGYQNNYVGSTRISIADSLSGWSAGTSSARGIGHTTNGGGPIYYIGLKALGNSIPNKFILYQNYPNPFNSRTNIQFELTRKNFVGLDIYNILGVQIVVLVNQILDPGSYKIDWDSGNYSSGVYFYRLKVEGQTVDTKKMILTK